MRKLSCKWPVRLTQIAVAMPVLKVFFGFVYGRSVSAILSDQHFWGLVAGAVGWTIIAWFIYGVACLLASPKSEKNHIVYRKDKTRKADKDEKDNQPKDEQKR